MFLLEFPWRMHCFVSGLGYYLRQLMHKPTITPKTPYYNKEMVYFLAQPPVQHLANQMTVSSLATAAH